MKANERHFNLKRVNKQNTLLLYVDGILFEDEAPKRLPRPVNRDICQKLLEDIVRYRLALGEGSVPQRRHYLTMNMSKILSGREGGNNTNKIEEHENGFKATSITLWLRKRKHSSECQGKALR